MIGRKLTRAERFRYGKITLVTMVVFVPVYACFVREARAKLGMGLNTSAFGVAIPAVVFAYAIGWGIHDGLAIVLRGVSALFSKTHD
jgi:hypothetical protein